jgi:hypothetical protein
VRRLAVAVAVLAFGCKGAEGPVGPTGAKGDPGPGTRLVLSAIINASGSASVPLPAAAGTALENPPALSCYTHSGTTSSWLAVSDGYSLVSPYCGLNLSGAAFTAVMVNGSPGWTALFVVVY